MATSREQFEQGLKNRTSSVVGFINRKGPGYKSYPSTAPQPVANTTKSLEELRAQNQPAKTALQTAYQANKPVASGSASATSPAKDQFVNRVAAVAPVAPKPAAPGTPGGLDPAMVGSQIMAQNRQSPISASPTPNQNTQDAWLQQLADKNPELADQVMDSMGYTGNTPSRTTSLPGQDVAYKEAYTQYIQSLAPGKDSTAARQKYLDFIQSRDLGLQEIEDKPIPMRFVTGQQASLQKLAEIEGARLRGDVELTQGADQATQQANLARLNFEQSLLAREDEKNKPIEVGGRLVDPRTGQVVYEPPAGSEGPIELSPGATLYDPATGKALYTAPEKNGQPRFEQIGNTLLRINDDGSVSSVFSSETGEEVKLSPAQQTDIADIRTTVSLVDQLLGYATDGLEGVGPIAGPLGAAGTKLFGTGTEEAINVRQLIGNIKAGIAKLRAGTSFTANEQKLLETYAPSENESAASVVAKLNNLRNYLAEREKNIYGVAGGSSQVNAPSSATTDFSW